MKRNPQKTWLLSALVLLCGCGGEMKTSHPLSPPPAGPASGPPPPSHNLSANWQIGITPTVPAGVLPATLAGSVIQSESTLTAELHVDGWTCFDQHTAISLTGVITDGNISLTSASVDGQVLTLAGAITTKSNFADVLNGT